MGRDPRRAAEPPAQQRFTTAIWHYARRLACSHQGKHAEAEAEARAFAQLAADPALASIG